MILGDNLYQTALAVIEDREVLDQIKETGLFARPPNQSFQRDDALFAFAVDAFPVGEMLPPRRYAADLGLAAVRQDDDGVVPEQLWDRAFVIPQVVLVGVFDFAVRFLQFDED
jgi:hypothetical protein